MVVLAPLSDTSQGSRNDEMKENNKTDIKWENVTLNSKEKRMNKTGRSQLEHLAQKEYLRSQGNFGKLHYLRSTSVIGCMPSALILFI